MGVPWNHSAAPPHRFSESVVHSKAARTTFESDEVEQVAPMRHWLGAPELSKS